MACATVETLSLGGGSFQVARSPGCGPVSVRPSSGVKLRRLISLFGNVFEASVARQPLDKGGRLCDAMGFRGDGHNGTSVPRVARPRIGRSKARPRANLGVGCCKTARLFCPTSAASAFLVPRQLLSLRNVSSGAVSK